MVDVGASVHDLTGTARELWRGRLVPIDPGLLPADLAGPVRDLLVADGLPTDASDDFEFFHDERLRPVERLGRGYLVIGYIGSPLVIDRVTGEVQEFYRREPEPPRFLNSSIPAFLAFLARYLVRREEIFADRAAGERVAAGLAEEFRAWDAPALAGPGTAWSATLRGTAGGIA
jgi:hypothetical protein